LNERFKKKVIEGRNSGKQQEEMPMIFTNGQIVLEDGILENGSVVVEDGKIRCISAEPMDGEDTFDLHGDYLVPGFVDIHCHGGGDHWFFENPEKAAEYHLKEGTTSLLCSLWRNAGTYSFKKSIQNILRAAKLPGTPIRGIHMEGPYLDPAYGSDGGTPYPISPEEYESLFELADGMIKTWTFDPCQDHAMEFARYAQKQGTVLSVCYSKASPELLLDYVPFGLRIGNHMLCGSSFPTTRFAGTREPGSDEFVLYYDFMTAEVIADSMGAHVRPFYLKYIYKVKGADRIALVSDCCTGGDTCGSDINIINGELYGSRLTLSVALRNMVMHTKAGMVDLCKMVSTTPAKVTGFYGEYGSIAPGKQADLVVLDKGLHVKKVMLHGEFIHRV
jgi:N-acetylglucosamine-6-phosphate deacetylase